MLWSGVEEMVFGFPEFATTVFQAYGPGLDF